MSHIYNLYCILFFSSFFISCEKPEDKVNDPAQNIQVEDIVVSTKSVSNIGFYSASVSASVSIKAGVVLKNIGICFSRNVLPEITDSVMYGFPSQLNSTFLLSGLFSDTKYYIRAFAIDTSDNIVYGNEVSFSTLFAADTLAQILTYPVTFVGMDSVVCGAELTKNSSSTIYSVGLCWSTNPQPTINDSKLTATLVNGKFTTSINHLKFATGYYIRAYIINAAGISYGPQRVFATEHFTYGNYMKGGYVFHLFKEGEEGYVSNEHHGFVYERVLPTQHYWSPNKMNQLVGVYDSALFAGVQNTSMIIEAHGDTINYAAKACANFEKNGFSDWYLPSLLEGKLAHKNLRFVFYWTSTEVNKDSVYLFDGRKASKSARVYPVVAIRRF